MIFIYIYIYIYIYIHTYIHTCTIYIYMFFPMGKAEPPTIAVHANRNTQEYNQVRPTIDNAAANVKESKK